MGLLNINKLEKLTIKAYDKADRVVGTEKTFKVMFNPDTYFESYQNVFTGMQPVDSSTSAATYAMSRPANLSLKIIFDGTGTAAYNDSLVFISSKNVYKEVQAFLNATFHMDGSSHEPKFLTIAWGSLDFDCRMEEVTINYTLFDQSGKPLRAELDTSFVNDVEADKRNKLERKTSPDLTHKRVVKGGDTLLLLCESIYGTPDYYLQVAKANRLTDFRNLIPGQELFFPPINK